MGGRRQMGGNPLDRDNDMEVPSASDERLGGPIRRNRERPSATPYSRPTVPLRRPSALQRSVPESSQGAVKSITIGSNKVLVTNLDSSINEEDIEEIFEGAGGIKSVNLKKDAQGRSLGTAEVVFAKRAVALKTVEDYDGAAVDGRPMYLRLLESAGGATGTTVVRKRPEQERFRVAVTHVEDSRFGRDVRDVDEQPFSRGSFLGGGSKEAIFGSKMEELDYAQENFSVFGGRRGFMGGRGGAGRAFNSRGRGGARGGRGRGGERFGGGGRDKSVPSAEQLDKDMDSYFGGSKLTSGAAMDEA